METITLTRPFAQLNFGAIDEMIKMTPRQSSVKVSQVYNTLDLKDGSVKDPNSTGTYVEFKMTDIPQIKGETFPVDNVDQYLSMSYLLVPADAGLIKEVTFTLPDGAETNPQISTHTFTNVPVRRNYRTNIYGQMNSPTANQATFIVEVDKEYGKPAFNRSGVTAGGNYYATIAEAIADNQTVIELGEDSYIIPNEAKGKTLEFFGTGDPEKTKIHINGESGVLDGSEVTFKNLTISTSNGNYKGFVGMNGTYNDCIIENLYTLYGDSEFKNCIFNVEGDNYNIWTYGANATFTDCTFNCDGKVVLIYNEGAVTDKVTFTNCTFIDNEGMEQKKAAIEIAESAYGNKSNHTVEITDCTVSGFSVTEDKNPNAAEGTDLGTNLWGNKDRIPVDRLIVKVDGTEVY